MWIWLVLLYGTLKGFREICKKKALLTCSSIEVLLVYSLVAFALVCPDAPKATGLEFHFYFWIAVKAFFVFLAWICGFRAIRHLPLSYYGVLDLSRVLFATLLGVLVLGEVMSPFNIVGLILVGSGLLLLKFQPKQFWAKLTAGKVNAASASAETGAKLTAKKVNATSANAETGAKLAAGKADAFAGEQVTIVQSEESAASVEMKTSDEESVPTKFVLLALASCLLNALSGLMDKILMQKMNSSQLQFWYMLFLCIFYVIYAVIAHAQIDLKKTLTNKWIWLLSIMFVIADRALFVANGMDGSQITIMTLLKQVGCIVTIIAGRLVFKEKNILHKLICACVIIAGIVLGVF